MQQIEASHLPVRAALKADGLYLELRDIPAGELRDPFMQQTVDRVTARQTLVHISKENLRNVPVNNPPVGMIFHVGRCGSTLLSQLLKQNQNIVVYAEPLPINEIVVAASKWTREEIVNALRVLCFYFARHARKPYVLKLSSWNTLFCEQMIAAFPATPWALSVRDPLEVCVSLLNDRPGWLQDAGSQTNLFASRVDPIGKRATPEEFLAQLFAEYCEAITKVDRENGLAIAYESLPDSIWDSLAPHFNLLLDEATRARMQREANSYSKSPLGKVTTFVSDAEQKRSAASPTLRQAVDHIARPAYEKLLARFAKT